MTDKTKQLLRRHADTYETAGFVHGDPSSFMRSLKGARGGAANREATAFVAACLSFGALPQFMDRIGRLVDLAGGDMDAWIRSGAFRRALRGKGGRFYRYVTYGHLLAFLSAYSAILRRWGTLGAYVRERGDGTAAGALKAICAAFSGAGAGHLVPRAASSACKRLCLFLRWMVRGGSPVDLGLWEGFIDRRTLIVPLDTHVLKEARALGLLDGRAAATMATARRLTAQLAEAFPDDPARGDFALYGHHIAEAKGKGESE